MKGNNPLLSICVPTYNRAEALGVVLQHYVDNPEFDDEVELIISDNASTDNTKEVCVKYVEFCNRIRYYRNNENIRDANFPLVLGYGHGEYLKLLNDCLYLDEEGLRYMKEAVRAHLKDRTIIFFTNDYLYTKNATEYMECSNLDEYVQRVSTYITCNNIFGCWREDWYKIADKRRYSRLQLQQDDWTYQLVSLKKNSILYNRNILIYPPLSKPIYRAPYNWFQVHLDNYYKIMQPYIESGEISKATFEQDKLYLIHHFIPELTHFFFRKGGVFFESDGTFKILRKYYSLSYLLIFFTKVFFRISLRLPKIIKRMKKRNCSGTPVVDPRP